MIGPSSSHTAGANRLARVSRQIYGKPFERVTFHLFGSFAATYIGHGTDKALTAGILYAVAMVLFPMYFFFVVVEMILCFIAFARMKTSV